MDDEKELEENKEEFDPTLETDPLDPEELEEEEEGDLE